MKQTGHEHSDSYEHEHDSAVHGSAEHEHDCAEHEHDCEGHGHSDSAEHGHSAGHHHHHDDDDGCCEEGCSCHHHGDDDDEGEVSLKRLAVAFGLFVLALLLQKLPVFAPGGPLVTGDGAALAVKAASLALYFAAYMVAGFGVLREAAENLFHGKLFGEEFLMAVATVGAICLGEYPEAVIVMILFGLGEFLEDKAVGSSKKSIRSLMDVRPDTATVLRDGEQVVVRAEQVQVGERILVKPGERIPLDGTVVSGSSFADTSALTGESVPREILAGGEVLAGFVNQSGTLTVEVTKEFASSTVSRVLELVEHAQSKKARTQKFISRFSKVYTPAVCALALCVAVIPPLFLHQPVRTWVYRALMFLVVSCPCALVISVPLSFFAGIGLASRRGILVKGSNYIELLAKTRTAVFDKTGTLTKGVFEVTAVHPANEAQVSAEQLLALATHAEYFSNHPISRSLKNVHHCDQCQNVRVELSTEISGHGVSTQVDGHTVLAGNLRLMQREQVAGLVPCPQDDSGTVVHVAVDGQYAGHIVISDVSKADAKEAVRLLKKGGVTRTVLLTGDSESAASAVATELGLDEYHAELLPADKVSCLESLMQGGMSGGAVAFVGDGINDAPVLTRADVGIAMGALGSDAAIEAADVVIMDDMPSKVAEARQVSRRTMRIVWQNIVFALLVKAAIMVLSTLGITNMWIAVFGDVGVTMLAVANSMRLMVGSKK